MPGAQDQVGLEPVQGLLAQSYPLLLVEAGSVLALAGGGKGGEAGGVVAVRGLQVGGQFRLGREGGGGESRGGGVAPLLLSRESRSDQTER